MCYLLNMMQNRYSDIGKTYSQYKRQQFEQNDVKTFFFLPKPDRNHLLVGVRGAGGRESHCGLAFHLQKANLMFIHE